LEPFKNQYNEQSIRALGDHIHRVWSDFPCEAFVAQAVAGLESLELKERVQHTARALAACLPQDWVEAGDVLIAALGDEVDPERSGSGVMDTSGVRGSMIMVLGDVVVIRGMDRPEESLKVLKELTKRFTAEFAIRPFLRAHPAVTAALFDTWVHDPSAHVRRLVSEGSRPRLPWSFRLQVFADKPERTAAWLQALVDDPSLYVRRSVANHLGDIGKDQPDLAVALARRWMQKATPGRNWVVTHGLRYLLKKGHAGALEVLGYRAPSVEVSLEVDSQEIRIGESIKLGCHIISSSDRTQSLLIDYVVWHVRANGQRTASVFRWCKKQLHAGKTVSLSKSHSFRRVTTRRYYGGRHRIELQVNGRVFGGVEFELNEG
jgi:3-methyladenine DNA glycosylase AlkC